MPIRRPAHGCHGYSSSRNSVLWAFSSLVVLGDQTAHRHARKSVEQRQHSLPNGAADVFEIDIDPIRTGSLEFFGKARCTMIDGGIEAKFFDNRAAFFGAAGDADRSRASQLGELPDQ